MLNSTMPINANTIITKPFLEKIIMAACIHFGCTVEELMQKELGQDIVYRRKICFYLIMDNVTISYGRLALRFGFSYKSHGTVMKAVDEIRTHKNIYTRTKHDLEKILSIANNLV